MILYPNQAAHRRRSLPLPKPGSTTTTAAETAASSEKTSPGASDNSGVKSPVTEIQDPGIPETAMQQVLAVRQDRELNPNSGDIL